MRIHTDPDPGETLQSQKLGFAMKNNFKYTGTLCCTGMPYRMLYVKHTGTVP
jgi:hypothetical protein